MAASQPRSKLRNSIPTSSCRPLANSFRRKRDRARPEAEAPLAGGGRVGGLRRVVVDIGTEGFAVVADGGFFDQVGADVKMIQRAIPPLAQLVDRAREAGVLVVFIQAIYDPQYLSAPMRERDLRVGRQMPRCLTGSWGADFHVIAPRPNEPVVIKHRYSAFANSELDDLLKRRGIRSLLLAGGATDTCVESTGRDAYFSDYYVTLVADCCAGAAERDHLVALERF